MRRPGIEEFLAAQGLTTFFVETQAILGGELTGQAAGGGTGPYGEVVKRYSLPRAEHAPPTHRTTFEPYWVGQPQVAAIGRNVTTGLQVWSAEPRLSRATSCTASFTRRTTTPACTTGA